MVHPANSEPADPRLLLFVDPDPDTHDLYRQFLVPRRYIVEHAQDGRMALASALTRRPDVIVTEARVPGIDGISLCELLQKDPATRNVPILLLTADARPAIRDAALRVGATDVLVKPCLPDELWQALQRVRDTPNAPIQRLPVEERLTRTVARRHQRYVTTTPPASPPPLRCALCDAPLTYDRSYVGGVTAKFAEQWDHYHCPRGCGEFQYRHRTRRVRHLAA
jgi:CheY-like chemotaxis protein